MNEVEYERMYEAEQVSWWFRARRRILNDVIARLELPSSASIVDVGCGTGGNLPMLETHGEVVGVEYSPTGAEFARTRTSCPIVEGSATATSLDGGAYDLATMFDVLEHLEDDVAGLREVHRILKPGGTFLFTVPAFMMLWSAHDVALHHHRRYRRPKLRKGLEETGFEVDWISYYNTSLFPPVATVRLARKLVGGGDASADGVDVPPKPINAMLEGLFAVERHIVGRINLPFGVSLIGVAHKI
jgi:SAM-dependent methyltransferase